MLQRDLLMAPAHTPARWWTEETVAVVTGGNKGVGLDIVRSLAQEGLTVVLAARDEWRGLKATKELHDEGLKNVVFHQLDISKPASVSEFVDWIKQTYGGIDILVNNAGVLHLDNMKYPEAVETIDTNYFGTKNLTEQLLPHMKPSPNGARIVNLSTTGGWTITVSDEKLREKLTKLEFTDDSLDELAKEYLEVCKSGDEAKPAGYGNPYTFSKVLLNAYTRLLAQRVAHRPHGSTVYVNCVHPGMVDTGMYAKFRASVDDVQYAELQKSEVLEAQARTTASGADTAVWLALHPVHGPSGKFWFDRKEFSYVHGWA